MYCSQCGTQLPTNSKFCFKCGVATVLAPKNEDKFSIDYQEVAQKTSACPESPDTELLKLTLGIMWLKFWNYFSLPIGGILGIITSIAEPALGVVMVPLSIIHFAVAYGLYKWKLWAWNLNWVLIVVSYICIAYPTMNGLYNIHPLDIIVRSLIRLTLGGIIWMWPNYIYWKNRKVLFKQ